MTKLFLSLDDAVDIVNREFGIDRTIARQELQQKCYINSGDWEIGYHDGLSRVIRMVKQELMDAAGSGKEKP